MLKGRYELYLVECGETPSSRENIHQVLSLTKTCEVCILGGDKSINVRVVKKQVSGRDVLTSLTQ